MTKSDFPVQTSSLPENTGNLPQGTCHKPLITNKLWLTEPEIFSIQTEIIAIKSEAKTICLGTSESIAFPGGGGQAMDRSFINEVPVLETWEDGELCWFKIEKKGREFLKGEYVTITIDGEFRKDQMEQHSGQHILSAVLFRTFNLSTLAFHLGERDTTIDIDTVDFSSELILKVEIAVSNLLKSGAAFLTSTKKFDEIDNNLLRKDPPKVDSVRIVTIDGIDSVACCGTHFGSTFQVSPIMITRVERIKKKTRIHFLCGNRATKLMNERNTIINDMSCLLNSPPESLKTKLENVLSGFDELRGKITVLESEKVLSQAEEMIREQNTFVDGLQFLRWESNSIDPKEGGTLLTNLLKVENRLILLLFTSGDKMTIMLGNSALKDKPESLEDKLESSDDSFEYGRDCLRILKKALLVANGKGGGNASRAQGVVSTVDAEMAIEVINSEINRKTI
jgi:alanyl-tRNA synthetase